MPEYKMYVLLVVILVVIAGVYYYYNQNNISEGFGMLPSFGWKTDLEVGTQYGDMYSVRGSQEARLAPRFFNADLGAQIRYAKPRYENLAVPHNPVDMSNMVSDGYGSCTSNGCDGTGQEEYVRNASQNQVANCAKNNIRENFDENGVQGSNCNVDPSVYDNTYQDVDSIIPVGDMTSVNALGETQPIVYQERITTALKSSRLRGLGDPIRGDLPIEPVYNPQGWNYHGRPTIDLNQGAMNALGGSFNESTNKLAELVYRYSGNALGTIAGADINEQLAATLPPGQSAHQVVGFV